MTNKTKSQANNRRRIIIAGVIVVLVLLGIIAYASQKLANRSGAKPTPSSSFIPSPSEGPGKDTTTHAGPATDTSAPTATPVTNPDHPATSTLAKPIGPNNNTGSISRSGGSTLMESTCQSVSGASCYIQATMDGKTYRVAAEKAMPNGSAIFDWDVKQLTPGDWSVQAVATKDGSTATSDPQTLKVTP